MPQESLYDKILRQLSTLSGRYAPAPTMDAFLEEDLYPLTRDALLSNARNAAERLMLAPTEDAAIKELQADQAKTQAFFSMAKVGLPHLRNELSAIPRVANVGGLPFFEVAFWIHHLCDAE